VAMTAALVVLGVGIEPDRYFFLLLLPVLLLRRARRYVLDWAPFLLLLFSYEFLRGLAPALGGRVQYLAAIRIDSFLFGTVPTVTLQHWLYHPGSPRPYDYAATIVYFLHFVTPLSFALLLWLRDRGQFQRFMAGFIVLSYAALVTYVVLPAAPPWLAAQHGYLPPVHQVLTDTLRAFPSRLSLPGIYQAFDPNPVAALPSVHAAYPTLMLLFAVRCFGRRGLLVLPYGVAVWLAVVYMGEHYVTDVALGAAYATGAYVLVDRAWPALARRRLRAAGALVRAMTPGGAG
jgi:PAP2 superfamily protein